MLAEPIVNEASWSVLFVMRYFGLYPNSTSSRWYIYYGYSILLIFSWTYTLSMILGLCQLEDWTNSTEAIYMTLTEVAVTVKGLTFRFRVNNLNDLLKLARKFKLESDDEIDLLRRYIKWLVRLTIFFFAAVIYAQASVEIAAAFNPENVLPYSAWYPYFDWKQNNVHYWLLYIYQVIGLFITAFMNVCVEIVGALLLCMNTFQMEVLGIRMRKLGYARGNTVDGFKCSRDESTEVRSKLVRYIKHHQAILSYKNRVEELFSIPYLAQAGVSGIVLCCIANEMAGNKTFSEKLVITAMLPGMFLQTFVPCYVGNELWAEQDKLPTSFYSSNWIRFDDHQRKLIITAMEHMKKENFVRIGLIFPLTLMTFSKIINLAYRLFALLQNM